MEVSKQAVITTLCREQVMGSARVTAVNLAFNDYRCTSGIRIQAFQGTCLFTQQTIVASVNVSDNPSEELREAF